MAIGHENAPAWLRATSRVVFALGLVLCVDAAFAPQLSAQSGTAVIARDTGSKSAAREAKRAERAAAREAKRKERAARANHADDRSLAKASKKSSGSSVDLGDNDPLEGL